MNRLTNAEYMINILMDLLSENGKELHQISIDDGGASEESMIFYNIACPYFSGDPRCECKNNKPTDDITREQCVACKYNWLLNDIDE